VTVGVDPGFRRQGIGSSLLEYGLEWASDAGYQKLYQNLPATNEAAIEFLEENGWQREGQTRGAVLSRRGVRRRDHAGDVAPVVRSGS